MNAIAMCSFADKNYNNRYAHTSILYLLLFFYLLALTDVRYYYYFFIIITGLCGIDSFPVLFFFLFVSFIYVITIKIHVVELTRYNCV